VSKVKRKKGLQGQGGKPKERHNFREIKKGDLGGV